MKNIVIGLALLISLSLYAEDRYIVQINDKGETIPPNSVATPVQVQELGDRTASLRSTATTLREQAELCLTKVKAYATNTIVTSTCYAQSIGGVLYTPDLQTIKIGAIDVKGGNVVITGTLAVVPLIPPVLDWRYKLNEGDWDRLAVDAVEVPVQAAWLEDSAKAYSFTFPQPSGSNSMFFRIVDNSTGTSGSGLYWLVFGGIVVDGQIGYTGDIGPHKVVGGILVNSTPLGGI